MIRCRPTLALLMLFAMTLGASARTWTSSSGTQVEADLERVNGPNVVLVTPDGRKLTIPKSRLSAEDQTFIDGMENEARPDAGADAKPINPEHPGNPFGAWEPWQATRFRVDYPVVLRTDPQTLRLWFTAGNRGMDRMFAFYGPNLGDVPDSRAAMPFGADIIQGYDRPLDGLKYPLLTRASCAVLSDGSQVVLTAIGPRYAGGSELYPALIVSPTGKPGTWKHIGPPAGEPAEWLEKARSVNGRFRIEGGSLFELPGGTLRMYIHGFLDPKELDRIARRSRGKGEGPSLMSSSMLIAEAPGVEGPWTFLRDRAGNCININEGLTKDCEWLFPSVMKIGEHGYMLTGGDKWPPTAAWAAFSVNGVYFDIPSRRGHKPEPVLRCTDIVPGTDAMKVLRGAYNPDTGLFEAVANVSIPEGWHVYHSRCAFDVGIFKRLSKQASTATWSAKD